MDGVSDETFAKFLHKNSTHDPENLFDGSISSTSIRERQFLSFWKPSFSLLPSSRREGKESRLTLTSEKKKEKVDSNTFRVFHLTEGGGERQGRKRARSGSIEGRWRDGELVVVVRHATRTQSHFHKFSQVLRQLVPSNSRRTVSPFPSILLSRPNRALSAPSRPRRSFFPLPLSYGG